MSFCTICNRATAVECGGCYSKLRGERDDLRARVERLRAVGRYGEHAYGCRARIDGARGDCGCGYRKALAALQPGDMEDG